MIAPRLTSGSLTRRLRGARLHDVSRPADSRYGWFDRLAPRLGRWIVLQHRLVASSRASGPAGGRDTLLSVSVLFKGTEHPLLRSSADDSEASGEGRPI